MASSNACLGKWRNRFRGWKCAQQGQAWSPKSPIRGPGVASTGGSHGPRQPAPPLSSSPGLSPQEGKETLTHAETFCRSWGQFQTQMVSHCPHDPQRHTLHSSGSSRSLYNALRNKAAGLSLRVPARGFRKQPCSWRNQQSRPPAGDP